MIMEGYHGKAVYDGNTFIVDEESAFLDRKLIDSDGDYWYGGTHGRLILQYADGKVDSTSIKPYIDRNVNSIYQDRDQFFIVTNEGILIAKKTNAGVEIRKTIRTNGIDTWSVRTVQDTLYLKGIRQNQYYIGPDFKDPIVYRRNKDWRIDNGIFNLVDGRIIIPRVNGDTILTQDSYIHQFLSNIDTDNIYTALLDSKGRCWVAIHNKRGKNGLYLLKEETPDNLQYIDIGADSATIAVRALFEDHLGHMWVGTHANGVSVVYDHPVQIADERLGLNGNNVWGIYQAKNEDINFLLACDGISTLSVDNSISTIDEADCSWTMLEDAKGQIWRAPGLSCYKDGKPLKTYPNSYTESNAIHVPIVWSLMEDSNHNLWIGTQQAIHKLENGVIQKFIVPGLDLSEYIFDIIEYRPKHLIFVTQSGSLFTYANEQFSKIEIPGHPSRIYMDSDSLVWISTLKNGIFSWDGNDLESYAHLNGVPNYISIMQEDANGNIWGICGDKNEVFALPKKGLLNQRDDIQVSYYNMKHGIPLITSNIFAQHTAERLTNGKLIFGNIYGGIIIDPDIINYKAPAFNIELKADKELVAGITVNLPKEKNYTILSPAAINIHPGLPVELEYKTDDTWYPVLEESISLNNIKPGKSSIQIRSRYRNHQWQEPITYFINRPALLQEKTWFRSLIGLLLMMGIYTITKWRTRYVVAQNAKLEDRIREQVQVIEKDRSKIQEALSEQKKLTTELTLATASKNRMYARIAHEFKSPLQSVKSILVKGNISDGIQDDRIRALNNVDSLLKTSNEIMEMSKAKEGKLRAEKNWYNILGIIRDQVELISDLAADKNITINFQKPKEAIYVKVDIFLISQVIGNLLSNAIKYSPRESHIDIVSEINEKHITVSVQDQGYGISAEEINLITTPYYRSESAKGAGTGIGLSLADEILKLHDSRIHIKSTVNKGSTFSFMLPLPLLDNKELVNSLKSEKIIGTAINNILNPDRKIILTVDDSEDILRFIVRSFKNDYYVVTAQNGQDGIYQLEHITPDLIISDINMPFMDGISFLNEVRAISKFKTIPFLFLTGSRTEEIEILGLKSGADQILQKPIKVDYLISHVTQILSRKSEVENKVLSAMADRILPNNIQSDDVMLLENLETVILEHLSNPKLKSTDIALYLQVGEKTLRNRVKKITGLTVKEYLRNFRLEKAKLLLQSKQGTISEIANATGFLTASYFSKCYKQHFGKNPSELKK